MGCRPSYQGNRLVMDCITCGLGLTTSACLDSHLKTISTLETPWKTMRYEEEMIVELDEEKSKVFSEYVAIVRQIEGLLINPAIYGRPEDDQYAARQKLLRDFYAAMFQSPAQAAQLLSDYNEPQPEKAVFTEGYRTFRAWVNGILATYKKSRLYNLSLKDEDLRQTFMALLGLRSMPAVQSVLKAVPAGAKVIEGGEYELPFGLHVKIYEVPGADSYLYVIDNPVVENLPKPLVSLLQDTISEENKSLKQIVDYTTIFDSKMRTFRQKFLDFASLNNIPLTPAQALAMGREAAAWTVGLGSPIENMSLDRDNLTDIYIDAENAAIYIEHQKFGLCHTLWQYNHEMMERAFRNVVITVGGSRKFDKDNPIIDVVLPRLAMRCHLQRPPATFADLQAALRIMKEQPFTYAEYLKYQSFTPFFAGYDDVLVGLGCSEAVLGLKGVGKTAFTAAKIAAIGLKRRILPIQDIEEIPVRAYRKRGFHIGGVRVQSSDREETSNTSS
ncbi:MAG: Flp pilus assembly complex ATPase component TadA, partial [Candidatus Micrarchaeota archaeon]|nr:Flp pilus assembly complex ATPase component TadA [Candidatus Micrarchaeota archaeon]